MSLSEQYMYKTAREAGRKAEQAEKAAEDAQAAAENAETQLRNLSEQYIRLSERYVALSQSYIEIRGKTLSLDAALQARALGRISEDEYVAAQQWHSWKKWVQEGNELGWHELWEHSRCVEGLAPIVRSAVEMELERVKRQALERKEQSSEEKEYERRLQLLLSSEHIEQTHAQNNSLEAFSE